jgi:hypothetical protein
MEEPELSIPVIWTEDDGAQQAGRLDVFDDRLHLDGGSRASRALRDVRYEEIAAARIGRDVADRINGRAAMVVELLTGSRVSFVGFDRPGTLLELLHRVETRLAV